MKKSDFYHELMEAFEWGYRAALGARGNSDLTTEKYQDMRIASNSYAHDRANVRVPTDPEI